MDKPFQNDYNQNGYAVIKNLVPTSRINALLENIYNLYKKYSKDKGPD